jgi:hypothetical protein
MYTPKLHTHFQGQIQNHITDITQKSTDYDINILLTTYVYGSIAERMTFKTTLGTRPLLAMTLHTMSRSSKTVSLYRKKNIRMKDHL